MMKNTKCFAKLTSAIICIMLLFSVMPATADTAECILLNGENFNIPVYTNGGYIDNGGTALNTLFAKSMKIAADGNVRYATARVYIAEEGSYNLWVLSANEVESLTDRYAKVGFDSEAMQTVNPHKDHNWDKTEWTLTAGWHDLKVGICDAWKNTLVNALYITNDLTYVPDVATDDELLAFIDTTAPVIGDGNITTEVEGSNCLVTFPEATDGDNTALYYEYTLNGSTVQIANIAESVNVGTVTEDTTITLTVYDKLGNKAEKTFTITAPDQPALPEGENMLLSYENFNVPAYTNGGNINDPYDAQNDLFATSFYINHDGNVRYSTARVYIAEEGTYNLWVLSGYAAGDNTRYAKVSFDDQAMQNVNGHKDHAWDKTEWTLTAGWHELKVGIGEGWKPVYVNAIYITNDLTYVPDTATDDEHLLAFADTTAPVIGEADITVDTEESDYIVTFPEATDDDNTILYYEYTLNGSTVAIADIAESVNIGAVMADTTITLTVYDKLGNKAEKTFDISALEPPALPEGENMLLSYENFNVPAYSNGGCVNDPGDALNEIFGTSFYINQDGNERYSTARVYIEEEGTYNLWVLSCYAAGDNTRFAKVGFDDQAMQNVRAHKDHAWDKTEWALTKGWHNLKVGIGNSWKPVYVNALYITNDLTYVPEIATDNTLLAYCDTTAPEFTSNSIGVEYTDYTTCTLRFPEISDTTTVVDAAYYINNESVAATNGSIEITGLKPLEKLSLKVEACDKFGNKAVFEDEYLSAFVKTESFKIIKNGTSETLQNLSNLTAGDIIKLDTKLYNHTSKAKTVELTMCLYSADYKRMLLCITSDVSLGANAENVPASVSLTLPGDFVNTSGCIVSATLWDKTSGEPYIEGIEIKGAE